MPINNAFLGGTLDGAVNDPSQRLAFYRNLTNRLDALESAVPQVVDATIDIPPAATFTVTGKDGNWTVIITNPQDIQPQTVAQLQNLDLQNLNPTLRKIQHDLQRSVDLAFDTQANITELLTYDTNIVVKEPNQTKYWRLRSRYDGGNYNQWQIFQDVHLCGPAKVWSGLLVSTSTDILNSAATTTDGSNALSQSGATTQINVAAKSWNVGPQVIAYNSGSVNPGAFGTYHIYAIDTHRAGGAVTFLATLNTGDITKADGAIYFGHITTNAGGGATGSGGGSGGGCTVTGTKIRRMDGTGTEVQKLFKGDIVQGFDGGPEVLQADPKPHTINCFVIIVENGLRLECAGTHDLSRAGGGYVKAERLDVGDKILTVLGESVVKSKKFTAKKIVWELRLDRTKRYCADGFYSHNKIAGNL